MSVSNTVPKIRFPQFESNWSNYDFGDLVDLFLGLTYTPNYVEHGVPFLSVKDLGGGKISFAKTRFISNEEFNKSTANSKPKKGDVIYGRVGTLGSPVVLENEKDFCIFVSLGFFRVKENTYYNYFLKYWMESPQFWKQVRIQVAGSSQKNLNTGWLKKFKLSMPSYEEQKKISNFLMITDKKIEKLQKKLNLLQSYRQSSLLQVFSQGIRFKNYRNSVFPNWKDERVDYFVEKASEPVDVKPDKTYREIGVRSHGKGVFHKEEIKGHELGNKRVFWLHPDAFVVNIVFAWEHAVAKTSDQEIGFIASHRFPMFIPKNDRVDIRFFTLFFLSKRGKHLLGLASPGGAGRNKTLGQSNFAELKVSFPSLEEQIKIADFYEAFDKKIKLVEKQIVQTQTFKKGLLQQLYV